MNIYLLGWRGVRHYRGGVGYVHIMDEHMVATWGGSSIPHPILYDIYCLML